MSSYFELGGYPIAIKAGLEFSQSYETLSGTAIHRMQSGRAIKQTHFKKLKTVLSGKGWVPTGLEHLDYSKPLLLKCAVPLSITSALCQLILPVASRNDMRYTPTGFALIGGKLLETNLSIQGNIVNLESVNDAKYYQVHYFPELLVYAEPPQIHGDVSGSEFTWSLTCEEV